MYIHTEQGVRGATKAINITQRENEVKMAMKSVLEWISIGPRGKRYKPDSVTHRVSELMALRDGFKRVESPVLEVEVWEKFGGKKIEISKKKSNLFFFSLSFRRRRFFLPISMDAFEKIKRGSKMTHPWKS